ncbi:MAG: hypothetical protein PHW04_16825 [Candidatus Wallbacteria bacterium]|nr:hypothetical protein [Candidatus Wallbacteria bacterium]
MKIRILFLLLLAAAVSMASNDRAAERLLLNGMTLIDSQKMLEIKFQDDFFHPLLKLVVLPPVNLTDEELSEFKTRLSQIHLKDKKGHETVTENRIKAVLSSFSRRYTLYIDEDRDGEPEFEIEPGILRANNKKIGLTVDSLINVERTLYGPNTKLMPDFRRVLLELHELLDNKTIMADRPFKFNRIVIRYLEDGNLIIVLKDEFFRTGKDLIIETNFDWGLDQ